MLPPCLVTTTISGTTPCASDSSCSSNIATYALNYYTTYAKTYTVLGIAKDGHKIIGPYYSSGSKIDCSDLD